MGHCFDLIYRDVRSRVKILEFPRLARMEGIYMEELVKKNKILKEKEAALLLGVSYSFLKGLRMRGGIRHLRIGKAIRYNRLDLEEFLELRYVEPQNS